ncbi:MAG: methyltransferase [Myxococcota bacterium]|nr:methyltransferase [Myxococcota bacterium]
MSISWRPLPCPARPALAWILASLALVLGPAASAAPSESATERLQRAIASPDRSSESRARDAARHPLQTLQFFGVEPDMQVLELWPGGGWYTEILAVFLTGDGSLAITNYDPTGPQDQAQHRYARVLADRLAADPARFGAIEVIEIEPPDRFDLGAKDRFDRILTFRNNHGWIRGGYHDQVYREAFRVLKPGGVLGVVQHRAPDGADALASAENGYVPEAYVIEAAQRAGFRLDARSEINANPRDTKDHPKGVWTLPPSFRLGDVDRAKYEAIGESDRMTLRFVKPAPPAP